MRDPVLEVHGQPVVDRALRPGPGLEEPKTVRSVSVVLIDALVIRVRRNESVSPMAALIATGITSEGQREILGLTLGDSENEASWNAMLEDLKRRGLCGVDLIVSDDHKGLKNAARKHFQGVRWQRCQVHFLRNILGHAPASKRGPLAMALGRLFLTDTKEEARGLTNKIRRSF